MTSKELKDFKISRAKSELEINIYKTINNFESVEEPDIKLNEKDIQSVLAEMLYKMLNRK